MRPLVLVAACWCILSVVVSAQESRTNPKVATEAGDVIMTVGQGKAVRIRAGTGAAEKVATENLVYSSVDQLGRAANYNISSSLSALEASTDIRINGLTARQNEIFDSMNSAQVELVQNLTTRLSETESRIAEADANMSNSVAEELSLLRDQVSYLYNYTRSDPPTISPTISPTRTPIRCADLPPGTPSGTYRIMLAEGITDVYCEMEIDNGGWNLCAHAGGARVSGGNRHWYGNFGGVDVNFTNARQEKTFCGRVAAMREILIMQTGPDLSIDSAIKVRWYDTGPNRPPQARGHPISRDVTYISTARAGSMVTNRAWSDSNYAFTEHFYFTFSDRSRSGNYRNNVVQIYEIGGHRNGRHQHYEECCCGGGGRGDGTIGAGTYKTGCHGCHRFTCGADRHVFFFFR